MNVWAIALVAVCIPIDVWYWTEDWRERRASDRAKRARR
jgi:hypothetical protein